MTLHYRSAKLEIRAVEGSKPGTIEGYASVFGNRNSYGELFAPGAFTASLQDRTPKMLYMHDVRRPCGVWSECVADNVGLKVRGELILDVPDGATCNALMKAGALDGLSIGFYPEKWDYEEATDTITHTAIRLIEISPVTFPSDDMARAQVVRNALIRGSVPTIRELEAGLRDALGLSAREAKALLASGYKALTSERDAMASEGKAQSETTQLLAALANTLKGMQA